MNRIMVAVGMIVFCSYGVFARETQSIPKVDRQCGYLVSETQTGRYSISKEKMILYRKVQTKKDGGLSLSVFPLERIGW